MRAGCRTPEQKKNCVYSSMQDLRKICFVRKHRFYRDPVNSERNKPPLVSGESRSIPKSLIKGVYFLFLKEVYYRINL